MSIGWRFEFERGRRRRRDVETLVEQSERQFRGEQRQKEEGQRQGEEIPMASRKSVPSERRAFSTFRLVSVTPPLKNVRKRRFRKVARQKTQDHDEIEKEVRRLFRFVSTGRKLQMVDNVLLTFCSADNEAVDVKWEIIDDDQEVETYKPIDKDPSGKRRSRRSDVERTFSSFF